jgi:hypothetical protein
MRMKQINQEKDFTCERTNTSDFKLKKTCRRYIINHSEFTEFRNFCLYYYTVPHIQSIGFIMTNKAKLLRTITVTSFINYILYL